ncbi:MAG: hypothetical protein K2W95_31675 [Candidatus Obscuribacterales bacterium]|nr:hypothetical protein [Candidatus Obscuribacterales bacterium]
MNVLFTNGYAFAGLAVLVLLLLLLARRARRQGKSEDVSALTALEKQIVALMNEGKFDEARGALEHGVEEARGKGRIQFELRFLHNLGVVFHKKGDNARAVNYFTDVVDRLIREGPGSEDFLYLARTNLQRAQLALNPPKALPGEKKARAVEPEAAAIVQPPVDWPVVDTRAAQAQINELFSKGDEALRSHDHSRAGDFYSEACDVCAEAMKVDSPFMAAALNRLAMARIGDGYFTHAQELLDRAEVIMSEWPERDTQLHESIARNQSKCREERGF